jgi:hypothetical protein
VLGVGVVAMVLGVAFMAQPAPDSSGDAETGS